MNGMSPVTRAKIEAKIALLPPTSQRLPSRLDWLDFNVGYNAGLTAWDDRFQQGEPRTARRRDAWGLGFNKGVDDAKKGLEHIMRDVEAFNEVVRATTI